MAKKSSSKAKPSTSAMPTPSNRRNVCIEKISNGYILTESGMRGDKFFERRTFTPKQPKVLIKDQ